MASDPRITAEELFKRIWGVGPATAKLLYEAPHNCRTIEDVRAALARQPTLLDGRAHVGLKYFEDLDSSKPENRIPRAEIEAIVGVVRAAAEKCLKCDPAGLIVEALGSYRRGKPDSGVRCHNIAAVWVAFSPSGSHSSRDSSDVVADRTVTCC